jgi:hypothetical protein
MNEKFFCQTRRFFAGILGGFQEKATQSGEKDGGKMCAVIYSVVPQ